MAARSAILHGRRASILPAEVLGGAGDIAEAWAAGTLAIGDPDTAAERAAEWPADGPPNPANPLKNYAVHTTHIDIL